jgi:hypothetical protein
MEGHMHRAAFVIVSGLITAAAAGAAAQTKAPTPLAGRWEGTRPGEGGQSEPVALVFEVKDQTFTGTMYRGGGEFGQIAEGKINGAKITFTVRDIPFEGVIDGDTMKVSVLFDNQTQEFTVRKKPAGAAHARGPASD